MGGYIRSHFKTISASSFQGCGLSEATKIVLFQRLTAMPKKSKSNRRKSKNPKQQWQVKNPTRNWLDLPLDLMLNILERVGAYDILENAQKVCTAWREICKDPVMWRVIYIDAWSFRNLCVFYWDVTKYAVDRSQGQLLDLTIIYACDEERLQYIADRSSQLRRLEIKFGLRKLPSEAFKKLSLLEELSLIEIDISEEDIEVVGHYCPLLKSLKVNQKLIYTENEIGFAIGKNLPQLTHLELTWNCISNTALQAILDDCSHLESLDLRGCENLDLNGDLGKRCSQQIKYLKLPNKLLDHSEDELSDYDIPPNDGNIEDLRKMVAKFKATFE